MLGVAGVTLMDTSTAGVTVRLVEPLMPVAGSVAVIVVDPGATEEARPFNPDALEMVAVLVFDELQVADVVKFWVLESLNVPVAANCRV